MSLSLDPLQISAAITIMAIGATVQAAVGFGMGLIAAPILLLIDPRLVPGPLMSAGVILSLLIAYRDRQGIDVMGLKFALWGRLFGLAPAALVLSFASQRWFDVIFAGLVLLAVSLSLGGYTFQPTPRRAIIAGATSGFMGTISGIGGPPIAILYQRARGKELRGTLSGYFTIGATLSLIALVCIGRLGWQELRLAFVLLPGIGLGFLCSAPIAVRLDQASVRPLVLGLSLVATITVLVRAIAAD